MDVISFTEKYRLDFLEVGSNSLDRLLGLFVENLYLDNLANPVGSLPGTIGGFDRYKT